MSLFKSLFGKGRNIDPAEKLEKFAQLIYPCSKCSTDIDISQQYALTMSHCPGCNELFMVPMRLQDWWVCEPLGGGGMGAVYLGRHSQQPELTAAVKVLQVNDQTNQVFLDMLIKEAEIASKFGKHPLLAQVYAYGYDGDDAFMIMEFINGLRFDKLIQINKSGVNQELSLYYLLDILSALEYMWHCGYLYRDLKPENLILRDTGYVTLVDYGLCMTLNEAWNNDSEDIMGSPLYMPPERITGEGEDFRADFYALGMVVFHMMSGAPYFSQTELMKIVQRQFGGLRVQTKFKLAKQHPLVIELVDRLIRINRDERYANYHEIRVAVHNALIELHKDPRMTDKTTLQRRQLYIKACLGQ